MALVLLQTLIHDPFEYLLFQDMSGKYTWGLYIHSQTSTVALLSLGMGMDK